MSELALPFAYALDWSVVTANSGPLLRGLRLTLEITAVGYVVAVALGLPLVLMRVSRSPLLHLPALLWISLARAVPQLIALYWLYYAAAERHLLTVSPFGAGVLMLGLTGSGYMAEILRSALLAVPVGQREAACALGLGPSTQFGRVVLPQALRTAVPPAVNLLVAMLKGATLVSVIGLADMFYVARQVAVDQFRPFELYTAAALLIIAVTLLCSFLSMGAERYLARGRG